MSTKRAVDPERLIKEGLPGLLTAVGITSGTLKKEGNYTCSFCGKTRAEVEYMIAGPGVCLCSECLEICNDIVAEARTKAFDKLRTHAEALEARVRELEGDQPDVPEVTR